MQLAADLYSQSQVSGAVQSARLGSASYTLNTTSKTLAKGPRFRSDRAVRRARQGDRSVDVIWSLVTGHWSLVTGHL